MEILFVKNICAFTVEKHKGFTAFIVCGVFSLWISVIVLQGW